MPPKITTRGSANITDVVEQLKDLNDCVLKKSDFEKVITDLRDEIKSMVETIVDEVRAEFAEKIKEKDDIIDDLQVTVNKQKRDIGILSDRVAVAGSALNTIKFEQNRAEQYSRRHSLRLTGVPRKRDETSDDCLNIVKKIITKIPGLNIPDAVLDRAHRIGASSGNRPPSIIFKFTTWRHRTMFYRKREEIYNEFKWKVTLDITRENMQIIGEVRQHIEANMSDQIKYVFCDVNCQPTIRTSDDRFLRFSTPDEAFSLLEKELFPRPATEGTAEIGTSSNGAARHEPVADEVAPTEPSVETGVTATSDAVDGEVAQVPDAIVIGAVTQAELGTVASVTDVSTAGARRIHEYFART